MQRGATIGGSSVKSACDVWSLSVLRCTKRRILSKIASLLALNCPASDRRVSCRQFVESRYRLSFWQPDRDAGRSAHATNGIAKVKEQTVTCTTTQRQSLWWMKSALLLRAELTAPSGRTISHKRYYQLQQPTTPSLRRCLVIVLILCCYGLSTISFLLRADCIHQTRTIALSTCFQLHRLSIASTTRAAFADMKRYDTRKSIGQQLKLTENCQCSPAHRF